MATKVLYILPHIHPFIHSFKFMTYLVTLNIPKLSTSKIIKIH